MIADAVSLRPAAPAHYRWMVLLACSLAMFGNYYVFDALYPVTPMLEETFGFTGEQIGLLDTAYNVAALLTLIAGGVLIDRIGMASSAVLFGALGALGGVLIAVLPAAFPGSAWLGMMIGRFLLGIGAELFIVAATTVVGRWFKGTEISFALAVQLFVARGGSWVADKSPQMFRELFTSWQPPLILAAGLAVSWFVFAVIYAVLERVAARRYQVAHAVATDKLVLSDLVRFDRAYWWVVGICVAFYATIFPFRSFANIYLIDAHGMEPGAAGELKSMLPLFSMFGMPLFGLLADRIGKRTLLMMLGSLLLVLPFLLLLYTDLPPVLSIGTMGVAFALVPAVLWPAVTYLVPEGRLGSAYALMTFCQQLFWAGMSPAVGSVRDSAGWTPVMGMLAALSSAGLLFSILLWRSERGPNAHGLERAKV